MPRKKKLIQSTGLRSKEEWDKLYETTVLEKNIPKCPWAVYSEKWVSWFDFLGKPGGEFREFCQARQYIRNLHLTKASDWRTYCASGNKPGDIPSSPKSVYSSDWINMQDWLGSSPLPVLLDFTKARKYIHRLKLKNWRKYIQSGQKPDFIPATPWQTYSEEWINMGDWIGNFSRDYHSFEKCLTHVQKLGIASSTEWKNYCKSGKKPSWIPSNPNTTFKDKWQGMGHWLGTGRIATFNMQYRSYEEVKKYAKDLGIRSSLDWKKHCNAGKLPKDIPTQLHKVYEDQWTTWGAFLDNGFIAYQKRSHRPFAEAKDFVHQLKLKTRDEWEKYCNSGNKPDDIPTGPSMVYKEWTYWGDWLGTGYLKHKKKPEEQCNSCDRMIKDRGKDYGGLGMCRRCYKKHRRKLKPHICSSCNEQCFIEGKGRCKKCYRKLKHN